jgi:maltooligosyltrehalose trehalohydrolase
MEAGFRPSLGAVPLSDGRTSFRVWAPNAERVRLRLLPADGEAERVLDLQREPRGYWRALVDRAPPGSRYVFRLGEGPELPDPASRWQPDGVHGASAVVDREADWTDAGWRGLRLEELVFYELHVGAFTPEGTFDAVIPQLDLLRELGITCVELMPVAQFAGDRNWGYDGVFPFAPQNTYGGPAGLRRLVDACHARGMALCLDAVYNHLGPEGNCTGKYGQYDSELHRTPWGGALNFDGRGSDEVRRFCIENALSWVVDFHVDALRMDAVHAIVDTSATPFLKELAEAVHRVADRLGRRVHLVAESDLNDPRLVLPPELGGFGLDAQWNDDFHHALHVLLTGERQSYFQDFGSIADLGRAFRGGYVFTGQYSGYRGRRHGAAAAGVPARRFVVFAQNHDQVGNRAGSQRLTTLIEFESLKLAASTVCLSPFLPLLFMGEEYGETVPFPFFASHTQPELIEAVRAGRKALLGGAPGPQPPDPLAAATFESARLKPARCTADRHVQLLHLYRELLRLRRDLPALAQAGRDELEAIPFEETRTLYVRRWCERHEVVLLLHFEDSVDQISLPLPPGGWGTVLDTRDAQWGGPGSLLPRELESDGSLTLELAPWSAALLERRD